MEKETKYTLAFHAEGKKLFLSIFTENKYYVKLNFQKEGANPTGAKDGAGRWVVLNDAHSKFVKNGRVIFPMLLRFTFETAFSS